ncbi:hypothetical protein AU156_gp295 [Edwardsiella phage PEi20]|uniref:Uncharacterized protein n=2 Tax=Kanagawavirus pei20 TaxID=2844109 RepID=A0A0B6VPD2_9CAUD|nr:hypothetical protein AU156_gp295 [Edwardsiella phage PEi20]BAQ22805.1 conserved hypothetical protein [Edwardsiella phage PEi20]BAQ23108.1 conserved hypothetical protein [Edwardsiella phage PEi26]
MIKLFAQITKPENGYLPDQEASKRHIEQNGSEYLYEVERVDIGRSSTDVHLKDIRWEFNSVNLSFFISEDGKQVREYDIFENKLKLKRIQHTYINMLLR